MVSENKKKKMGRPTNNPKETRITARLDSETNEILEQYSMEKNKTKAESIRHSIRLLKKEL